MSEETKTPRPTGKNAAQDAELAELRGMVQALTAALAAGGKRVFKIDSEVPAEVTRAAFAENSTEPRSYLALEDGTDINQGYITAGTIFTTTQPPGRWMQPVDAE